MNTYKTIATRFHDECQCPEHDILMHHISATVHIEPNGTGEAFVFFGDWEEEWFFSSVSDIDDLKRQTWERFISRPSV